MSDTIVEEMLRSAREMIEKALREIADRAALKKSGADRGLVEKIVLRQVLKMMDVAIAALEGPPESDSVVVYGILAEECAPILGQPPTEIFSALVEICGEPHGPSGLPEPRAAVIEALHRELVAVTVEYRVRPGARGARIIKVLYDADREKVRRKRIEQDITWDDVPEEARARIIREGNDGVTLTLPVGRA